MKKIILLSILMLTCLCGCNLESLDKTIKDEIKDSTKPNVDCTVDKQYKESSYTYYIEGKCVNNGSKDYDYLQIEFICYDKNGNNLGTALDNTNNLLAGQTWKFKAMDFSSESSNIDHCDFHEVTGW